MTTNINTGAEMITTGERANGRTGERANGRTGEPARRWGRAARALLRWVTLLSAFSAFAESERASQAFPFLYIDAPAPPLDAPPATLTVHLDAYGVADSTKDPPLVGFQVDACPAQPFAMAQVGGTFKFRATFDLSPGGPCKDPVNPVNPTIDKLQAYLATILRFGVVLGTGPSQIVAPYDLSANQVVLSVQDHDDPATNALMKGEIPDHRYQPAPLNVGINPVTSSVVVLVPKPGANGLNPDDALFGRQPRSLATWLYDKAGTMQGMRMTPPPSRFTVSCGSMDGGDSAAALTGALYGRVALDLLDSELRLARAAGCNTIDLIGFNTLDDQVVLHAVNNVFQGMDRRSWKYAEVDWRTSADDQQIIGAPPPALADLILTGAVDFFRQPCWDGGGGAWPCGLDSIVRHMLTDYQRSNHVAPPLGVPLDYLTWADEGVMFYPTSPPGAPYAPFANPPTGPTHRLPLLPGQLQWGYGPGAETSALSQYVQTSGLALADFGAPPGVNWNTFFSAPFDPAIDQWVSCTAAPHENLPGCANQPAQLPLSQRHLLYWIMDYLQYSWAAGGAMMRYIAQATLTGRTAIVRDLRVQPTDILPYRLYGDTQVDAQQGRVVLWPNWKRHGAVGDNWTEYHHADSQLNVYDLNIAMMQSSTLNVEKPLACSLGPPGLTPGYPPAPPGVPGPPTCEPSKEYHRTGASIVLRNAGGANPGTPGGGVNLSFPGDRYRFLSAIGHGTSLLELYTLGPQAFFNSDDNAWSDHDLSLTMNSALDAVQRSENVLFGARRDRPVAAIVMPTFSSALWNGNSEWSRYDFEIAGLYLALAHSGVDVDFIDDRDIVQWPGFWRPPDGLGGYAVIYVASPYLTKPAKASLLTFVEQGGVLALSPGAATLDEYGDFDDTIYSAYFAATGASTQNFLCCTPPGGLPGSCSPFDTISSDCSGPLASAWNDARAAFQPPVAMYCPATPDQDPNHALDPDCIADPQHPRVANPNNLLRGTALLGGASLAVPGRVVVDIHQTPWDPAGDPVSDACLFPYEGLHGVQLCPPPGANAAAIRSVHPANSYGLPSAGSIVMYRFYPGSSYLYSAGRNHDGSFQGGWAGCGPFGQSAGCDPVLPVGWDPALAALVWQPHTLAAVWKQTKPTATAYYDINHPEVPAPGIEVLPWRCPPDGAPDCEPNSIGVVLLNFRGDHANDPQYLYVQVDNVLDPWLRANWAIIGEQASVPGPFPVSVDNQGGVTVQIPTPDADVLLLKRTFN